MLEAKSPFLHSLGWGLPALLPVAALVMHQVCQTTFTFAPNHRNTNKEDFLRRQTEKKSPQVEGDELTGVCLLGAQTDASLLHQLVRSSIIIIDHYYIINIFNHYNLSLVYQKYILSEEF